MSDIESRQSISPRIPTQAVSLRPIRLSYSTENDARLPRPLVELDLPHSQEINEVDMNEGYSVLQDERLKSINVDDEDTDLMASSSVDSAGSHLELVPYGQDWTVILRNDLRGDVVLYNTANRAVTVTRTHGNIQNVTNRDHSNSNVCVFCRRPFNEAPSIPHPMQPSFMDINYFRLLASATSTTSTPVQSRSSSPTFGNSSPSSFRATRSTSNPENSSPSNNNPFNNIHLSTEAFNQGYYERFFIEKDKLGKGFRGSVFLCQHVLDQVPLGQYAVKKVAVGDNHTWLVRMLREVNLLERLHHPNIINYKHAWLEHHHLTQFGPLVPCLFILMECANGGNLEEYFEAEPTLASPLPRHMSVHRPIAVPTSARERVKQRIKQQQQNCQASNPVARKQRRMLSLKEIWSLFLDTCEGLGHLHMLGIIHRDLKPPNLLLSWDEAGKGGRGAQNIPRVLISDFGECEVLDDLTVRDRTGATGTMEFMAPELIMVDERGRYFDNYSTKSDMWSLGMVLYYLCYSTLPWRNIDDVDVLRSEILGYEHVLFPNHSNSVSNANFVFRTDIPVELKNLIKVLLSRNPDHRPSCDEILARVREMRHTFAMQEGSESRMSTGAFLGNSSLLRTSDEDHRNASLGDSAEANGSDAREEDAEGKGKNKARMNEIDLPMAEARDIPEKYEDMVTTDGEQSSEDDMSMTGKKRINSDQYIGPGVSKRRKSQEKMPNSHEKDFPSKVVGGNESQRLALLPVSISLSSHSLDTLTQRAYFHINSHTMEQLLKIGFAIAKVISCTRMCRPYMPSPWLLYPVLALAILDNWTSNRFWSLALAIAHVGWIGLFWMTGLTCSVI